MKIVIPVHSFVDLITNSSSETYVCCGSRTVDAVYELIEALFNQAAHPGLKARDFFTVTLTDRLDYDDNPSPERGQFISIVAKDSTDVRQAAVVKALTSLFGSISAQEVYNG
jgi:hypothetical protein